MRLTTLIVLTATLTLVGCGKSENSSGKSNSGDTENRSALQIERASMAQLNLISAVQISGNTIIMEGFSIKSSNHPNAYYVSTKIYGPGIEKGVAAVWFISGDKNSPGLIQNVDGAARNFTPDLPYGYDTKSRASIRDRDAKAVKKHAEDNL